MAPTVGSRRASSRTPSAADTCTLADRRKEESWGALTSVVTGAVSYIILYVGTRSGLDVISSNAISVVLGNLISYCTDILLAKRCFQDHDSHAEITLPMTAFKQKALWMMRGIITYGFVRFVVTVVIELLVTTVLIDYTRRTLDAKGVWNSTPKQKLWRDIGIAVVVSLIAFNVFSNRLRFSWAYRPDVPFIMDIVVYAWLTLLLVNYASFAKATSPAASIIDSIAAAAARRPPTAAAAPAPLQPALPAALPAALPVATESFAEGALSRPPATYGLPPAGGSGGAPGQPRVEVVRLKPAEWLDWASLVTR